MEGETSVWLKTAEPPPPVLNALPTTNTTAVYNLKCLVWECVFAGADGHLVWLTLILQDL